MKKAHHFVLSLFFLILIAIPVFWLVRGKPSSQVSIVEGRVLGVPEKSYPTLKIALDYIRQGKPELAIALVWDLYTGGSLQRKFDNAATDQFPLRMPLILFSKAVDRQIIKFVYMFSDDVVIPADMTSDFYIILDEDALIYPPDTLDQKSFESIDERIANYQEIIATYPDLNVYVYYIETLQRSQWHPLNHYFVKADKGQAFNYFQAHMPDQITIGTMPLKSLNDHLTYYFRTDHHWNAQGILEAYKGIYEMLSLKIPDLPPKIQPSRIITFPIEFLGSLARKTLYPLRADIFIGYEAEFPDCIVSDQGVIGDYDYREEYHLGFFSTTPYIDHYEFYFGTQTGLLEYNCETGSDRDILIIGDSYTRPLVPLLATQYDHTYFVDLRQTKDFTLSGFWLEHPVDDLLVVSDFDVIFMDTDLWMIKP